MGFILHSIQYAKRSTQVRRKRVLIKDGTPIETIGKILKKINLASKGDKSALFKHYLENNHTDIKNIGLESAYKIMFLVQPEFKNLDYKESV